MFLKVVVDNLFNMIGILKLLFKYFLSVFLVLFYDLNRVLLFLVGLLVIEIVKVVVVDLFVFEFFINENMVFVNLILCFVFRNVVINEEVVNIIVSFSSKFFLICFKYIFY